jgi:AAA+ ATPase superfamily predicted ATPase
MIFTIYIQSGIERIELARYKLTHVDDLKQLISKIFEEQKQWIQGSERMKKAWKYEIVLIDDIGRKINLIKLHELIHLKEEVTIFFGLTEETISEILAEGIV